MPNKIDFHPHVKPLLPIKTQLAPHGQPRGKIKGLLFDIYGTLFISGSGDISTARTMSREGKEMEALFQKFSIPQPPQLIQERLHAAIQETHRTLRQKGIDFPEVTIDKLWMEILELDDMKQVRAFASEYEMLVNPVYPMPHLSEMLAGCRENRILMGIVSNAQFYTPGLFPLFLGTDLDHLGFCSDLIFYSYQFGIAKPSLFMFERAAGALLDTGISPESVVYLGNDMRNDMVPARKAGFQTALFAGDKRSLRLRENDPRCKVLTPDLVITDLIQILDHLG